MKKTLFALSALFAGLAAADTLEEWTLEQNGTMHATGGGSHNGVVFNLQEAVDTNTATITGEVETLPTTLNLDAVSIKLRASATSTERYLYLVDTTTNVVVGISDSTATASGNEYLTFSFSDVTISSTTTYHAFLTTSVDVLTVGEELTSNHYESAPLALAPLASGGNAASYGLMSGTSQTVTAYTPVMSITVSTPAVPEPATATLSLLALAGLAARRRRALHAA